MDGQPVDDGRRADGISRRRLGTAALALEIGRAHV